MIKLFNLLAESTTNSSSLTGDPNPFGSIMVWIVPIALIIIFMFINSRQRKKQQAEVEQKMNNIKVGDVVKTIGLVYGEIVEVDKEMETFVIKTGSEENYSFIKVDKMAIYQVIPPLSNQEPAVEEAVEEVVEEAVTENAEENKD